MSEIVGLSRSALDRARLSRDARFDGRFFIAVTSTGIYCRPICPSPSSKKTNVRYYPTAAAAAEAGFRPCLRCRPEAAPGTPAWLGTSTVVRRALRMIEDGALDEASVAALAARVGIGPRHLSRLFVQHVGASPLTVAKTRRLQFAKHLVDETDLPITAIALAAGFGSLRRFNEAFRQTYRRAPRELRARRRGGHAREDGDGVFLRLAFHPPYDWPALAAFLAARAVPGVERVDARGYARTVAVDGGHAVVRVRPLEGEDALELRVVGAAPAALLQLSSTARRAFDVTCDPARIARALRQDPLLAPLVRLRPGLRIPGAWDPFECAALALLDRRADREAAAALAARVVARAGRPLAPLDDGLTHLFPTPAALASTPLDGLGLADAEEAALRSLARAVHGAALDLGGPADDVVRALAALPGFDAARAAHVALRAYGDPDAFPAADPALRAATAAAGQPLSERALAARAEAWRPWRGYAALHLSCAASGARGARAVPIRAARGELTVATRGPAKSGARGRR